jgi:hypothetical protein
LEVVIRAGEQSEVDKAVFSLNGNSCFQQICLSRSLGSGAIREPKRRRVVFDGSLARVGLL